MERSVRYQYITVSTVGLLIMFIVGVVVGFNQGVGESRKTAAEDRDSMPTAVLHEHDVRVVEPPIPTVDIVVEPDPKKGWNLHVVTEHFTFAPERVNDTYRKGEGHAHLYLNGERLTRLYSDWYHLGALPPGEHVITLSLSANDHSELLADGVPIAASQVIVVE